MANLIFSSENGRVAKILSSRDFELAMLTFPGFEFDTLNAIINTSTFDFKSAYQATDTIGGNVLLTSFGESLAPAVVGGMIFEDVCGDRNRQTSGVERVINWWYQNNLTRSSVPLEITIGRSFPSSVYLADLTIGAQQAQDRVWAFSMTLLRIPPRKYLENAVSGGFSIANNTPVQSAAAPANNLSSIPTDLSELQQLAEFARVNRGSSTATSIAITPNAFAIAAGYDRVDIGSRSPLDLV